MSNTLAIVLGSFIIALLAADFLLNGGVATLFLAKKFVDMTTWMAFWR